MSISEDIARWLLPVIALVTAVFIVWRRKRGFSYLFCLLIFVIYLVVTLDRALFPILDLGDLTDAERLRTFEANVNWLPFYFGPYGTLESSLSTLLLNAALTIPFGFGISFVARIQQKHLIRVVLIGGLGIETAQLMISLWLGYAYRIIDVNDVLMNTLGVLIGYGLFMAFARLYVGATHRFGIHHRGLTVYVYEVTVSAITASATIPSPIASG